MFAKIKRVRIPVELHKIQESKQNHGISCTISPDALDNSQLIAVIPGPPDSPYDGGKFEVNIKVGDQYPFQPPTIKFQTPIFHPNIDSNGNICLDLLRMPPTGTYNPAITLESILISIRLLLASPNPDDPLQGDAADMYKTNRELFDKTAKRHMNRRLDQMEVEREPSENTNKTEYVQDHDAGTSKITQPTYSTKDSITKENILQASSKELSRKYSTAIGKESPDGNFEGRPKRPRID